MAVSFAPAVAVAVEAAVASHPCAIAFVRNCPPMGAAGSFSLVAAAAAVDHVVVVVVVVSHVAVVDLDLVVDDSGDLHFAAARQLCPLLLQRGSSPSSAIPSLFCVKFSSGCCVAWLPETAVVVSGSPPLLL